MKEKIKVIILLIVFVLILIIISKVLDRKTTLDINDNIENEIIYNYEIENIIEKNNTISNDLIQNEIENPNENVVQSTVSNENNTGKVIEVTEDIFEDEVLKSDKTVLIDFYADWCGPCKVLSPIVEEVAKENPDLKVVKIDVDANENLSYKYRTYSIPTLVVIKDGKEVNRAVGVISKSDILKLVK